ncbi:hypothetical protein NDK50_07950 [Paraburkholderia bryophila]|uniref:hypothetical protein n=1 Tax=Paraburkholderia bryophila TaxID=420952 RepID=UPI002349750A|nr:hypothetical protein [Paraburkholderia bryophila]WCM21369.1 hypothetical protein NDK50_07950 [Paraburkholderia bryophila]
MALPDFVLTGTAVLSANGVSKTVVIPAAGTPTQLIVTNLGPATAFFVLGNSSIQATVATGHAIVPNEPMVINLNGATNLSAITTGDNALLRISAAK